MSGLPTADSAPVTRVLARLRRRWQGGLALRALLRLAGLAAVLALAYGIADYFFAFPPGTIRGLNLALAVTLAVLALVGLARLLALDPTRTARRADALIDPARRPAQSALELARASAPAPDSLGGFLRARSLASADAALRALPSRRWLPLREIGRQGLVLLLQIAVVAGVVAWQWPAAKVIAARLRHPERDLPPYSPYVFEVTPERPAVLYGDDAPVAVRVGGAPVEGTVEFLTRRDGEVFETACFREGNGSYAQRLEKVVAPVEFCFRIGKARSPWHGIELLLQPRIAEATAEIVPPSYSARPSETFSVGTQDLAGLAGSAITLRLTSNRPLSGGTLEIIPDDDPANITPVEGTVAGGSGIVFRWHLATDARLAINVRDIRGTPGEEPFRLRQRLVPDEPPEAVVLDPPPFVLATPRTLVPIQGEARDDLGLRRLELVRSVVGYRDRIRELALTPRETRHPYTGGLDLGTLGTEPGQVLEFYLEASDFNPSMTGIGASDITRIEIISENEYAAMMRDRTTLEEFAARYRVLTDALDEVKKALEELKETAEKDPAADEKERAEKLDAARKANEVAREIFERIAKDFPAFDAEKALAKTAGEIAEKLGAAGEKLDALAPDTPGLAAKAGELLEALGMAQAEMARENALGEQIVALARIMELAGRFRQLRDAEEGIANRLDRFAEEAGYRNERLLNQLRTEQEEGRAALGQLRSDLVEAAQALPDEFLKLRDDSIAFAQAIEDRRIAETMRDAEKEGERKNGREMRHFAILALEKMDDLIRDGLPEGQPGEGEEGQGQGNGNEFAGMCRGGAGSSGQGNGLGSTLQQMLDAINRRLGRGQGDGGGMGMAGGGGGDAGGRGFRGGGNATPLNVPVYGPERLTLRPPPGPGSNRGRGDGRGNGDGRNDEGGAVSESSTFNPERATEPGGEAQNPEDFPEKYRDALRRYFSPDQTAGKPGSTP